MLITLSKINFIYKKYRKDVNEIKLIFVLLITLSKINFIYEKYMKDVNEIKLKFF